MPHVPASPTGAAEARPDAESFEPKLLLDWPQERTRPAWLYAVAASLALHVLLFFAGVQLGSFVTQTDQERRVIVHKTPLYLPPDVLTQREANRNKLSKHIDLAELMATQAAPQQRPSPAPAVRRFELPKETAKAAPQPQPAAPKILPEAPKLALNQTPAPLPPGAPASPIAPPPQPAPANSPFQNVGQEQAPAKPSLAPPNGSLEATIHTLSRDTNHSRMTVSDEADTRPSPMAPGSSAKDGGQHAAIELKSDPQGTDFRPYLAKILAIVRRNWFTVIPESARLGTRRGRTVVEFAINRDGSIPKLVVADPSGSEPLDRAAIAGLSMSNPLPPLPSDYKGLQVRLAFSFAYNLPSQ